MTNCRTFETNWGNSGAKGRIIKVDKVKRVERGASKDKTRERGTKKSEFLSMVH